MASNFEIAKAGWLFRQSTILHRWKRNWVVLYQDGSVKYFESPDSHTAEEAERMSSCRNIQAGTQVDQVDSLPEGHGRSSLLSLHFANAKWIFCAESPDDMKAWQMALEQARVLNVTPSAHPGAPPAYTQVAPGAGAPQQVVHVRGGTYPGQTVAYSYPGQMHYGSHPPQYVVQNQVQQGQPGTTTIVYTNGQPRYYRRGYDGTDIAMGAVAGAAIGSMMWGPLLWW